MEVRDSNAPLSLLASLPKGVDYQDMLSQKPVLLLDDVMSELDEHRRHALVEFISGDMQTFHHDGEPCLLR